MKINHGDRWFDHVDVQKIEKHYSAKYVGEFCIKDDRGNWSDSPVMVFYQPVLKDPSHSEYFGIFIRHGTTMICDASSTANIPIIGVESGGEIVYSRYRHDSRWTTDGNANIDGGRDYVRRTGAGREVVLAILDGELQVVEDPDPLYVQQKLRDA